MKKIIKICSCLFILLFLFLIIFEVFLGKKQKDDKPEKIDDLMIQKIRKTDRIDVKKFVSEEVVGGIDNDTSIQLVIDDDASIQLVINLVDSATVRYDLYEYIFSAYYLELYNDNDLIDIIGVYPTLNEIDFLYYNNKKRYDVDPEFMRKLDDFIENGMSN